MLLLMLHHLLLLLLLILYQVLLLLMPHLMLVDDLHFPHLPLSHHLPLVSEQQLSLQVAACAAKPAESLLLLLLMLPTVVEQ